MSTITFNHGAYQYYWWKLILPQDDNGAIAHTLLPAEYDMDGSGNLALGTPISIVIFDGCEGELKGAAFEMNYPRRTLWALSRERPSDHPGWVREPNPVMMPPSPDTEYETIYRRIGRLR